MTHKGQTRLASLAILLFSLILTACTAVAPGYQATVDNVKILQTIPDNAWAEPGHFSVADESLNQLRIRASAYNSPFNNSFAEYIKEALRTELQTAGRLGNQTHAVISGHVLKNSLDGSVGIGTASVVVRFTVTKGGKPIYEKVAIGETKWDSSFIGALAIPDAQRNHAEAVKQMLGKLFADPDFQRAIQ
ncbi:MAG: hypothetical protein HY254_15340 [Burkholderiales bacterium]|nr:hypothetical protein [Burkholderiales bacterium]